MVYSIGLESEYFNGQRVVRSKPTRDLRKISDETGGGYFELKTSDELKSTFSRVADELHVDQPRVTLGETLARSPDPVSLSALMPAPLNTTRWGGSLMLTRQWIGAAASTKRCRNECGVLRFARGTRRSPADQTSRLTACHVSKAMRLTPALGLCGTGCGSRIPA